MAASFHAEDLAAEAELRSREWMRGLLEGQEALLASLERRLALIWTEEGRPAGARVMNLLVAWIRTKRERLERVRHARGL